MRSGMYQVPFLSINKKLLIDNASRGGKGNLGWAQLRITNFERRKGIENSNRGESTANSIYTCCEACGCHSVCV